MLIENSEDIICNNVNVEESDSGVLIINFSGFFRDMSIKAPIYDRWFVAGALIILEKRGCFELFLNWIVGFNVWVFRSQSGLHTL